MVGSPLGKVEGVLTTPLECFITVRLEIVYCNHFSSFLN